MANYYIDTEFLEGTQTKRILGIPVGKTKPTIDLISIGIAAEDGREFYAISKDFNLKEAWGRWQQRTGEGDRNNTEPRLYWIRENVLKPIYEELHKKEMGVYYKMQEANVVPIIPTIGFTYKNLKKLINKYGKTNNQIAKEIKEFVGTKETVGNWEQVKDKMNTQFYAYYADYDWVAFCWLFGKMIDLPDGFPMYCVDLKQMLGGLFMNQEHKYANKTRLKAWLEDVKKNPNYPKQENEHSALDDARWNKKLHEFINKL